MVHASHQCIPAADLRWARDPSKRCSSNKLNKSRRQRSVITDQMTSAVNPVGSLWFNNILKDVDDSSGWVWMLADHNNKPWWKNGKRPLRSAPRGNRRQLLVAIQLWVGFLQGHPRLMGHATPWMWYLLVWILHCHWCIESVWPSRRAEGNGAVLRVNYMQSHTQFTPANLVREGTAMEAYGVLWGSTYVCTHASINACTPH